MIRDRKVWSLVFAVAGLFFGLHDFVLHFEPAFRGLLLGALSVALQWRDHANGDAP